MRAWLRLVFAVAAVPFSAAAPAADVWTPIGPHTGDVQTLALDPSAPSTLYAGTFGGGLYRTADGGAT